MARFFLHRFLLILPALWLVLTMVFLLIHIVPSDPVEQMLGESAGQEQARNCGTPLAFSEIRASFW